MKRLTACMIAMALTPAAMASVPAELMYLNKPVDPLCFFDMESDSDQIVLKKCGIAKEKVQIKGQNADLLKKGFIGFNWQSTDTSYASQGSSYYKWFDAGNKAWWVYTLNNGGGSGDFTAINLVRRESPDSLSLKSVAGGDRCNGGVQDVSVSNNRLTYSVNLTAADFLPLANDNPHKLEAYDDLSACAVCCTAKAFYEVDTNLKPKLTYVDISGHGSNPDELSQQGRYQACFNKLFVAYVNKGEVKLDSSKLKAFVKEFNQTCTPRKA